MPQLIDAQPLPIIKMDTYARSFDQMLHSEWLLTNGLGGFAMGTMLGCNIRRYHGLMVSSLRPPVERIHAISAVGESIYIDDEVHEMDCHEFHGENGSSFHPRGDQYLVHFEKGIHVGWTYNLGDYQLIKKLRLVWKRQLGVLEYEFKLKDGHSPAEKTHIALRPFVTIRDFHGLLLKTWGDNMSVDAGDKTLQVTRPGCPPVRFEIDNGSCHEYREWWTGFRRRIESDRQQDDFEDLFMPGKFEIPVDPNGSTTFRLAFGTEDIDWDAIEAPDGRAEHLAPIMENTVADLTDTTHNKEIQIMVASGDDFVVERTINDKPLKTVLAGYPWFADWGRDTMISLPGLLLSTKRYDEAKDTLFAYAATIRRGLIPNRFDDYGGDPHYNTVDGAMWFTNAMLEYMRLTEDEEAWNSTLRDAFINILHYYREGTDGPIYMDEDGLIYAGSAGTQLTWMDAARDGVIFTPRFGKPVEINALWYNGLHGFCEIDAKYNKAAKEQKEYKKMADLVEHSFNEVFWCEELGFLYDHVQDGYDENGEYEVYFQDMSLRPNQMIAVSLSYSALSKERQQSMVEACKNRLWTPMGMRTLPEDDWHYHPWYNGDLFSRDEAYHQGTVWAWPIGPFIEGLLNAYDYSDEAKAEAWRLTEPLREELLRHSIGQIHEVFDATEPHYPKGCMAQAWSIAELLRVTMLMLK